MDAPPWSPLLLSSLVVADSMVLVLVVGGGLQDRPHPHRSLACMHRRGHHCRFRH